MVGSTNNSGWVEVSQLLGESNRNNYIYVSQYFNNFFHPHNIDSTINMYFWIPWHTSHTTGRINPIKIHTKDFTRKIISMRQQTTIKHSVYDSTIQLPDKVRGANLLPGISHMSLVSIVNLCDSGYKAIFDEKIVNITSKVSSTLTLWRDRQTGIWDLPLHNQQTIKQNLYVEPTKQANNMCQTKKLARPS